MSRYIYNVSINLENNIFPLAVEENSQVKYKSSTTDWKNTNISNFPLHYSVTTSSSSFNTLVEVEGFKCALTNRNKQLISHSGDTYKYNISYTLKLLPTYRITNISYPKLTELKLSEGLSCTIPITLDVLPIDLSMNDFKLPKDFTIGGHSKLMEKPNKVTFENFAPKEDCDRISSITGCYLSYYFYVDENNYLVYERLYSFNNQQIQNYKITGNTVSFNIVLFLNKNYIDTRFTECTVDAFLGAYETDSLIILNKHNFGSFVCSSTCTNDFKIKVTNDLNLKIKKWNNADGYFKSVLDPKQICNKYYELPIEFNRDISDLELELFKIENYGHNCNDCDIKINRIDKNKLLILIKYPKEIIVSEMQRKNPYISLKIYLKHNDIRIQKDKEKINPAVHDFVYDDDIIYYYDLVENVVNLGEFTFVEFNKLVKSTNIELDTGFLITNKNSEDFDINDISIKVTKDSSAIEKPLSSCLSIIDNSNHDIDILKQGEKLDLNKIKRFFFLKKDFNVNSISRNDNLTIELIYLSPFSNKKYTVKSINKVIKDNLTLDDLPILDSNISINNKRYIKSYSLNYSRKKSVDINKINLTSSILVNGAEVDSFNNIINHPNTTNNGTYPFEKELSFPVHLNDTIQLNEILSYSIIKDTGTIIDEVFTGIINDNLNLIENIIIDNHISKDISVSSDLTLNVDETKVQEGKCFLEVISPSKDIDKFSLELCIQDNSNTNITSKKETLNTDISKDIFFPIKNLLIGNSYKNLINIKPISFLGLNLLNATETNYTTSFYDVIAKIITNLFDINLDINQLIYIINFEAERYFKGYNNFKINLFIIDNKGQLISTEQPTFTINSTEEKDKIKGSYKLKTDILNLPSSFENPCDVTITYDYD
jgi:hypothetical protein